MSGYALVGRSAVNRALQMHTSTLGKARYRRSGDEERRPSFALGGAMGLNALPFDRSVDAPLPC